MQLILDNIIFSLQRTGGISVVWSELEQRAAVDPDIALRVLDYPHQNLSRSTLTLSDEQCIAMPYRRLERYRTPHFRSGADTIFHSSYFRTLPGAHNITTVHDLTYHYYRRGLARAVHLWEEERALRLSERIICVSEATRRDLLRTYTWLDEAHVHVVHNGVHPAFRPIREAKQATPFPPGEYLLYVGTRAVGYKRFDAAVALARLTHRPLVMVGAPLSPKEQAWLDTELGTGHYHACGFLHEQELATIYSQAYCLVYLSDYEGFGIPVIEAQRCGCPVLVQRVSSLPEVAGEAAIYVDTPSSQPLVERAVDALRSAEGCLSSLIEAGYHNAARFSWDRCYLETRTIYQSI